jgi:hypothetical protein
MSIWYKVEDREDVNLSADGKTIDVNFSGDDNGNIYVEIPIEFLPLDILPSQFKQEEQSAGEGELYEFIKWYSGMEESKIKKAYERFKDEQLKKK